MRKPIIGMAGHLYIETTSPVIGFEYDYNRNNYAKAIIEGGGVPLYIPVVDDIDIILEQVNACDGFLIPGGEDVDPLFYGENPLPLLNDTIPRVDRFQINLIKAAYKSNKPILAVCRGHHILNVTFGGTLYQDVSYATDNPLKHYQVTQLNEVTHSVKILPDSLLYNLFGESLLVNSAHHQSIDKIAKGFRKTAVAPDGIIEGIELNSNLFVVGVQWHPEMLLGLQSNMVPLFEKLVDAARCHV